jgi:hypothetical protein
MKIDELLRRLESIKIDENIGEKHKIVEYLAQKLNLIDSAYISYYIMTKDKTIYNFDSYRKLLESNKISPDDAYVYVEKYYSIRHDLVRYFYPFLVDKCLLLDAYLSKQGFSSYGIVLATGLKYVAMAIRFLNINRMVIEVVDIDTVATNTNLPTLIRNILGTKQIDDVRGKVASQLYSQLFAGYGFDEARELIYEYYKNHDTSLAKEVEVIKDAYNRIFQPFRIEYDLNTKQFQVGDSNEDR